MDRQAFVSIYHMRKWRLFTCQQINLPDPCESLDRSGNPDNNRMMETEGNWDFKFQVL